MMVYWKSDDFKAKSLTNTKNRLSNSYGGGPSLHTRDDVSRMQDGNTVDGQVDEEETSDEEANEEDDVEFVSCQFLLSKEQVTSAWIEAVTKGRLYGLGSENTTFVCGRDHTSMSTSTSTPTTHNFDSSDFQEAVNKVVEEKLSEMRARLQKEMQTTIQATIEAMRSSQPPI
ncbi:uncharacterized protein G2W53_041618 [Senna tora]|uniref:Uncharacterized protein n=1 Tax=Senna tora TaxID=362788 RepID=A0A834VYX7_9FABA|nr:uncharacterized protein G2W53_041618 [Senna tora]